MNQNIPTAMHRLVERCNAIDFDAVDQVAFCAFVEALPEDEFAALAAMLDEYRLPAFSPQRGFGYRTAGHAIDDAARQSIDAVNEIEEHVLRLLEELRYDRELQPDPGWLTVGRTDIEKGFWVVKRAIEKRARAVPQTPAAADAAEPETGWVLERGDSSPADPLYYFPYLQGEQWTTHDVNALRLARKEDAERLASALGVKCRVAEHQWG